MATFDELLEQVKNLPPPDLTDWDEIDLREVQPEWEGRIMTVLDKDGTTIKHYLKREQR